MSTPDGPYSPMFHGFHRVFFIAITLLFLLTLCQPAVAARDVRVAIHELRPSLYTDEQGKPAGFYVDIIQDIAVKEGWNILYIHGTFQENLDRLATGDIDLVMGMVNTQNRQKVYDFNHETAFGSWTQVYSLPGKDIKTILDLDKKRVAVLKGDTNNIAFRDYAAKFNIQPIYIERGSLDEVFDDVKNGDADAAVALWMGGQVSATSKYGLSATPVMFSPVSMGFAVPKGKNADLLQAIDRYLLLEKNDPTSFYSQTMNKWFGENAGWVIPPYIIYGLAAAIVLVALFVIISLLFRSQVRKKTAELIQKNEDLRSEVAHRTRAEKELVQKNEELQAAYEELTSIEEELRANYLELGKSERSLIQARKKLNVLNTLTFQDIQNGIFSLSGFVSLAKGGGCSETVQEYLKRGIEILGSIESSLRFAKNYQDMGISQPRWQNVNTIFLFAISHLDLSHLSRTVKLDGIEIYADPLLEMVLFSLAENVIRNGKGATMVAIHYQKTPEGLSILFEYDGPGIPAADKEKIFERGYGGKGESGLFLAREILSLTGISIRETGAEGTGARFEILVPEGAYRFLAKDKF